MCIYDDKEEYDLWCLGICQTMRVIFVFPQTVVFAFTQVPETAQISCDKKLQTIVLSIM